MEQLGVYLSEKQCLFEDFKGVNYSHALAIAKNIIYFSDTDSLFSRMRTYSSTLIDSMLENRLLLQAPYLFGTLVYFTKERLPLYHYIHQKEEHELKHTDSRKLLAFIKGEKSTTRQKIMEMFGWNREKTMAVLTDLRSSYRIIMVYIGTNWLIFDPQHLIADNTIMSQSKAVTELIYEIICAYGPITIPQIMKMLDFQGGRVSTSIIDLLEQQKVKRGNFIQQSSYESFLATSEEEYLSTFLSSYPSKNLKPTLEILPISDPLSKYWKHADFMNIKEVNSHLGFINGRPLFSFDYKIINDNLHITNITKSGEYSFYEELVEKKLKEFAENKGKIVILPQTQTDLIESQSQLFVKELQKRGYMLLSQGLGNNFSKGFIDSKAKLYSYQDLFILTLRYQQLHSKHQTSKKPEIIKLVSSLGLPLSKNALAVRIAKSGKELINQMQIDKQLMVGKFAGFHRGIIATKDFSIFSRLGPQRHIGVFEDRIFKLISTKEKITGQQLQQSLNLSPKVLIASLQKLEAANKIVQTKNIKDQFVWMTIDHFLTDSQRNYKSQKESWLEVIRRILSSNLPLTIDQLAMITSLSNTQVEMYVKDLLASGDIKANHYIKELKSMQYTTKERDQELLAFIASKEDEQETNFEIELTVIPYDDPLLVIYRTYLLERFTTRTFFSKILPNEYSELVLINGLPMAAIHFKKETEKTIINNIEILPEYDDLNTLVFLFSTIKEYCSAVKTEEMDKLLIRQLNNISIASPTGKKYGHLLEELGIDY